jgi:monofunctional glycosyltransferase
LSPRRRRPLLRFFRGLLLVAVAGVALVVALALLDVGRFPVESLAREAPERTALMREREAEAKRQGKRFHADRRWVPYSRISPLLRRAVLVAEDDAFFSHGGFDWNEIQESARKNLEERKVVRGGSTITQQLAKNLFLGSSRNPVRKIEEAFLAMRIERALSKRRIFELYLNSIEWGDGVFGIEAAARRHFGVSAAGLSPRQAVLLASVIINPRRYSPTAPARRIERRAQMIASRMRRRGHLTQDQYLEAIGKPPEKPSWFERLFGGGDLDTSLAPRDADEATADPAPEIAPDTLVPVPDAAPLPDTLPPEGDPAPG